MHQIPGSHHTCDKGWNTQCHMPASVKISTDVYRQKSLFSISFPVILALQLFPLNIRNVRNIYCGCSTENISKKI